MSVQDRFIQYLHEAALCTPAHRILLAVSGGKDSVLMAQLFVQAGYRVAIAHCNFGLRGEASDADEALVADLAGTLGVPFYRTSFQTAAYARAHGVSVQMAARELRYDWFEAIRAEQGYDYIAIAQHQNDTTETVLLNLVRGTGLAGLRGIRPKRGRIIRPLLFLTAEEVAAAVAVLQLEYRDDESNFSTKYARNKIRLEVIPKLKELNPGLERTVVASIGRFSAAYQVVQQYVEELRNRLFIKGEGQEWVIPLPGLLELAPREMLLFELFRPYHFSEAVLADLNRALEHGMPGKRYESVSHVLHVDRNCLLLAPVRQVEAEPVFWQEHAGGVRWSGIGFSARMGANEGIRPLPYTGQFDAESVVFPLQIRSWRQGDVFHPLGMAGSKKLSDFFVSLKIPRYKKHRVPVVVNGNGDILWVAPYRISDRYKITTETKKVLTLACDLHG